MWKTLSGNILYFGRAGRFRFEPAIRRPHGCARIAQQDSLAAHRERSQRREQELEDDSPDGVTTLPLGDQQLVFVLMEELRSLPKQYSPSLSMRYLEGDSRRTDSRRTDSTLAQIQGRLVRG